MESKTWSVKCYNELDADFGFDCGEFTVQQRLSKAVAKSIARYMRKTAPTFVSYFAVCEHNI